MKKEIILYAGLRVGVLAPVSPIKLLQRYDLGKINRYSLNMTRPGENIIPAFWNL